MTKFLLSLFLLLYGVSFTKETPTICLNMIVKNESKVIQRCLATVKDLIDYWVIVDTGSTDGTQNLIKEFLKDVPGQLYERPWADFGTNRQEALTLAKGKGDYLLFIDADERLEFSSPLEKSKLDQDCYFVTVREIAEQEPLDYQRPLLINNRLEWKWQGVLHEQLIKPDTNKFVFLTNVINVSNTLDGARSSDPQKYLKDAQVLEKALLKEPNNAKYVFYLAQCYANAGDYESAIKNYEKRSKMGDWDQEIFWSLYAKAKLQEHLQRPADVVIRGYCQAFQARPSRAEPLFRLVDYFLKQNNYILGYLLAKEAFSIPISSDVMFVEKYVYEYGLLFQFGNCALGLGKFDEASWAYNKLLENKNLPLEVKRQVKNNILVAKSKSLAQ